MGAVRRSVLELLAEHGCALSAREVTDTLAARRSPVSRPSVFRVLEQLDALELVQRVEFGEGVARFEPRWPGGEHHHHLFCERCSRIVPFHDPALEKAVAGAARRSEGFAMTAHDITLRGLCDACQAARGHTA